MRTKIALCLCCTLGYPLSLGPTIWLTKRGFLPPSIFVVYRPLRVISGLADPVEGAIMDYARWWDGLP
jgi:hypothetical protein